MADDFAGEKTEPATPRKRREAREKGQVARSQDLSTAVLLLSAFTLIYWLGPGFVNDAMTLFRRSFELLSVTSLTPESVVLATREGLPLIVGLIAPLLLSLFAISFLVNILQVGWTVSTQPLTPDLNKLNPVTGLQRLFSRRALMRLLFGIFKLVVVAVVVQASYRGYIAADSPDHFLLLMKSAPERAVTFAAGALFEVGGKASLALLVLAIIDYSFQRWQFSQDLRMTKQEVREEHKRMEGDPKLKERRRRVAQQLALQRMMHDVPKADVVITNPTHFACAIRYQEGQDRAPTLLAKGADHLALRMRELAAAHDVPVVEEPPLARMIYASTEVGSEIPPELYQQVARVLAFVYRVDRERRHADSATG